MPINKPNNGASQLLILLQIDFVTIICLTAKRWRFILCEQRINIAMRFNQLRSEAQYLPCSSQNSLNKESTSPAKLGQPPRGGYSSDRIAAATAAAVYTQC